MSKHTPGPWEIMNGGDIFSSIGSDSGDGVKADSNDGWQIAEVGYYSAFVDGMLVDLGEDVRQANARLIAAAPDLLDALKDAESELACHPRINSYVIDKVRAAIAKATGD